MNNFSIFGVHVKARVLGKEGGGHEKPIYRGRLPKKGRLSKKDLRRWGLSKKEGVRLIP